MNYESKWNTEIMGSQTICEQLKRAWTMIYNWNDASTKGHFPFSRLQDIYSVLKILSSFNNFKVKNQYSIFYFLVSVSSFIQNQDEEGDWVIYLRKEAHCSNFHLLKLWSDISNQYVERIPSDDRRQNKKRKQECVKKMKKQDLLADLKFLKTLYASKKKNTSCSKCAPDFEKQLIPSFVTMRPYAQSNQALKRQRTAEGHQLYGRK